MKNQTPAHIDLLREQLWLRFFDTPQPKAEKWMGRKISEAIEKELGEALEQRGLKGAPHPDTIVNFLNRNHVPKRKTLDALSWYLLGDADNFKGFRDFKEQHGPSSFIDKPLMVEEKQTNQKKVRVLALIAFFGAVTWIAFWNFQQHKNATTTIPFSTRFTNSNLDSLAVMGWTLFHDSISMACWNRPQYRNSGYLTLETWLGDFWLVNREYRPYVLNIPVHKLVCGSCCHIKVKMVNFNPYQRYQQAGLVILYEDSTAPLVRYTHAWGGPQKNNAHAVLRHSEYSCYNLFSEIELNKRAIVSIIQNENVINPIDSIVLDIVIDLGQYFFSYKIDEENDISIAAVKLELPKPKYIGLVAFQGRPEIPHPIYPVSDTIPAHFEYVVVKPCD